MFIKLSDVDLHPALAKVEIEINRLKKKILPASLISLMVSVDVKHHVTLKKKKKRPENYCWESRNQVWNQTINIYICELLQV